MKYVFSLWPVQEVTPGVCSVPTLEAFALDPETAYDIAQAQVPSGSHIWCWSQDPDGSCTMCGGPFHPATGHWVSEVRHWCGVCTRSMIKMYREMAPRRWGKVRFYDHAFVPPGTKERP